MQRISKENSMKIAYIGGGSKSWAWGFMSDLYCEKELSGEVLLYDIDKEAAIRNEKIGNSIPENNFVYKAVNSLKEALTGADFVIISILPGTFDEMQSDVHAPEEYGIYQSVGDTTGPGGILRAMRTIPMYIEIAQAIEKHSPNAWVINYTNPMSMCVETLYKVFPNIKAFGSCHEVFFEQKIMCEILREFLGIGGLDRHDIKTNIIGLNHFTWINKATYKGIDIIPLYHKFADKYQEDGFYSEAIKVVSTLAVYAPSNKGASKLRIDLFRRFGIVAAAGDRHLAEFCPGYWYLKDPEAVEKWGFFLTTVDYRRKLQAKRLAQAERFISGKEKFEIIPTGEEGVSQMKALMGLGDIVTNVNLPNAGQIGNMEVGRVVETNAFFTADKVTPCVAGNLPSMVHAMVTRVSDAYRQVVDSCLARDLDGCLPAFTNDPLVTIPHTQAEELFWKMVKNTEKYLDYYKK
jgi:alpha-galactosidase/6-phospho-beta-glucosidase family protein